MPIEIELTEADKAIIAREVKKNNEKLRRQLRKIKKTGTAGKETLEWLWANQLCGMTGPGNGFAYNHEELTARGERILAHLEADVAAPIPLDVWYTEAMNVDKGVCRRCRLPKEVSSEHDERCTWHPRNRAWDVYERVKANAGRERAAAAEGRTR